MSDYGYDDIDFETFCTTMLAACTEAVKAYPKRTPIYLDIYRATIWGNGDYEDYHPVDPKGNFMHEFIEARGGKPTKRTAAAFVEKYAYDFFLIFVNFRFEDLMHTDAMDEALAAAFRKPSPKPSKLDLILSNITPVSLRSLREAEEEIAEKAARKAKLAAGTVKLEAGAVNTRIYKGKEYTVRILEGGKHCSVNGQEFSSLSAAALGVAGQHVSGLKFWRFSH